VSPWPLSALERIRAAQALAAARRAAIRWGEAEQAREEAGEASARVAEARRRSTGTGGPDGNLAADLALAAASRACADRRARRAVAEGLRATREAERAREGARAASAEARVLRGRADALASGRRRWAARARRAREARGEREVEEAWGA
jgi:hypothetical protein